MRVLRKISAFGRRCVCVRVCVCVGDITSLQQHVFSNYRALHHEGKVLNNFEREIFGIRDESTKIQ